MLNVENKIKKFRKSFIKQGVILLFIAILALLSSFRNAMHLREHLMLSTEEYLSDVTVQMTKDISYTIQHKMMELANLTDSLSNTDSDMDEDKLISFFSRKQHILEFDPIIMIDRDGNYIMSSLSNEDFVCSPSSLLNMEGIQKSFEGKIHANYEAGGENLFYSAPIYDNNWEINSVLIGVRNKTNLQDMISSKSFSEKSLSCLIDSSGNLVLTSTDLTYFGQLSDIFADNNQMKETLQILMDDIKKGKDGIVKFTSAQNTENYLSYNNLHVNDWVLLTIIPSDLLTEDSSVYITRSFLILTVISIIFLLFMILLYFMYKKSQKEITDLAFKDILTGGINESGFILKYNRIRPQINPLYYSVVMMNVTDFKLINEKYGADTADVMLVYFYQVITRHLNISKHEFVTRSEADHFFLLLNETDSEQIQLRLDEIIEDINSFRNVKCPHHPVSFRIGVCIIDKQDAEMITLQDRARLSVQYRANNTTNKCNFYNAQIIEEINKEHELNASFQSSIDNKYFQVYLQPKVNLKDNTVGGAEALVRWQHPEKGFIFPSDFIPLFERNGRICQLDLYMFEQICILLNRWREEGRPLIPISVNLSRQHFQKPDFLTDFYELAKQYHIPENLIEFELTESTFFEEDQFKTVSESLVEMHELGFNCSLDDFGSGFSSLGLLKEFDVDALKLDRIFFLNMSQKSKYVITSLIGLSKKLNIETVAEGVEDDVQLEFLRSTQCDKVQGYVFSKPLPIKEFEQWADNQNNNARMHL